MEILNDNLSSVAPVACGMKLIKRGQSTTKLEDFELSSLIYIQLPSTFPNGQSRTTYTPLDSILFHIQLKFSRYSVQLLISNVQLTSYAKSNMQTSHAFSLPPHLLLKAFSETCYCVLTAPQPIAKAGYNTLFATLQVSATTDTITVANSSIQLQATPATLPKNMKSCIDMPTTCKPKPDISRAKISSHTGVIQLSLPSSMPNGNLYTSYTQCNALVSHVTITVLPSEIRIEFSSVKLALSDSSNTDLSSSIDINIHPLEIKKPLNVRSKITLSAPAQLTQNGFQNITFDVAIITELSSSIISLSCSSFDILSTNVSNKTPLLKIMEQVSMVEYLTISPKMNLSDALTLARMQTNGESPCTGDVEVELPDCFSTGFIKMTLPHPFPNGQPRTSYTALDSILFHLQLRISQFSIQLLISNVQLTEGAKTSAQSSSSLNLPQHLLVRQFNETFCCVFKSPQPITNAGYNSLFLSLQINANSSQLTVSCTSLQLHAAPITFPKNFKSIIALPCFPTLISDLISSRIPSHSGMVQLSLPSTMPNGNSYTSYTQCNSIVFHSSLNLTSSGIKIEISPLELAMSDNTSTDLTSSITFSIYPLEIKEPLKEIQSVTLPAPAHLSYSGFPEVTLDVTVESSSPSVVVISYSNIKFETKGNVETRKSSLKFKCSVLSADDNTNSKSNSNNVVAVCGMTILKDELFLLQQLKNPDEMDMFTGFIKIPIPNLFPNGQSRTSYTQMDTFIFHVQVKLSDFSIQFLISNVQLTNGSNISVQCSKVFKLPEHLLLTLFGETHCGLLRAPQPIASAGYNALLLTLQVDVDCNTVKVSSSSVQLQGTPVALPNNANFTIDMPKMCRLRHQPIVTKVPANCGKIQLALPSTMPNGNSYTSYTQCNSMLLHVGVTFSSSEMLMEFSPMELAVSDNSSTNLSSSTNLNIYPLEINESLNESMTVTLATPTHFVQYGFHQVSMTLTVTCSSASVIVLSFSNVVFHTSSPNKNNSSVSLNCFISMIEKLSAPLELKLSDPLDACAINEQSLLGSGCTSKFNYFKDFCLSGLIKIQLPNTFPNGGARTSYTQLDSVLFHLQLRCSQGSIQLLISNAQLSSNANSAIKNVHTFNFPKQLLLKTFSETRYCVSKAPQPITNVGYNSFFLTLQFNVDINSNALSVTCNTMQMHALAVTLPNNFKFLLDLPNSYTVNLDPLGISNFPSHAGSIQLQIPSTMPNGNPCTSYTQCNSMVFHAISTVTSSGIEIELSSLELAVTDTTSTDLTSLINFNIYPFEIQEPPNHFQTLKLSAPATLSSSGLQEVTFDLTFSCPSTSVISLSCSNIKILSSNTVVETSNINIKCSVSLAEEFESAVTLSSICNKIQVFDVSNFQLVRHIFMRCLCSPTDIASCSHYECLYISDRQGNKIHRLNPTGKAISWNLDHTPISICVSKMHHVLVVCNFSKLMEFTTRGNPIRELNLKGLPDGLFSFKVFKDDFFFMSKSPTQDSLYVNSSGIEHNCDLETTKGNEKDNKKCMERMERTRNEDNPVDTSDVLYVESLSLKLDHPNQICVDPHGCVYILSSRNSKVYSMLDSKSRKVKELLDLQRFGMRFPNHMCLDAENGRLYVSSNVGSKRFLIFKIDEGKLESVLWMT